MRYMPGIHFCAAPTYGQVKRIYWRDMKEILGPITKGKPSESELVINTIYDSELHLVGLDKPERIEGVPWRSGLIDEFADVKLQAWLENIRPSLSTPGLNTIADIIGVPDGLNHFYDLFEYAKGGDEDWLNHHWVSALVLEKKEIEAAMRELDPRTFRQEYEASFETATGRVYDNYGDENHSDRVFVPGDIHWCHDFNFLPLSSAIVQIHNEVPYVVDEIILEHAVARQAAEEFCERYKDHKNCKVTLYGDSSGRVGEKHGHVSDYVEIEQVLRSAGFTVQRKVPLANPSIKDGQNSLRAKILNANGDRSFFVNPDKAPTVDRGLKTVQLKSGSTFQEDESNNAQHVTTALRYFTNIRFPITGRGSLKVF